MFSATSAMFRFSGATRTRFPEHRPHRDPQRGAVPLHPAVGVGGDFAVGGPQRSHAVAAREITDDRVRFPQDEAVVLYGGHEAVRILALYSAVSFTPNCRPASTRWYGNPSSAQLQSTFFSI